MTDLDIYELLDKEQVLSESFEVEFKSAKGGLPGSLWESYSAFANSEGGSIILGITEDDNEFKLDGLSKEQVLKYQRLCWDQVNNKNKISINLLSNEDVKILESENGQYFLAILVPAAEYKSKPVHVGPDARTGTFKRNHTGDYKCSSEEVRQMIADSLPQKPDSRILDNFTLDDLDKTTISQFRQIFGSAKPGHPYLSEDDKGLLEKIGGWKKDRRTKKEGLTIAGLLMFGKHQSIIDALSDYHLDYQEITDPTLRWSDRIFPDGTWEANIFQFYRRVWPKISSSLPKPFQLQEGQRKDEDQLHEAIREALVNSLIHADYSIAGGVVIKKYQDYFLLSNPGNLLITIDQYYKGGISVPRNTSIQTMFILLGYGEKAGSGSTRILSTWEGQHWRKPYIQVINNPARVELYLRMESLLPPKSLNVLAELFGEQIKNMQGDGLIALTTAEIEGSITNIRLQQLINAHSSEISKMLKILCAHNYLIPFGKGRGTSYKLNKELKKVSIGDIKNTLANSMDTSGSNMDTSGNNMDTSRNNMETKTVESSKKRMKKSELNNKILSVCFGEYKTLSEISILINRDSKYLKNDIIPDMLKSNRLERLYPSNPNHPNQAYKAIDTYEN